MARRTRRANRDTELKNLHETILTAGREHSTPAAPASAPFNMNQLVEAHQMAQGGNRKQIKAPAYTGVGDVEMFVTQFMDVAHVNRWDERKVVLHLRSSLSDRAHDCGQ